jgi:hypothetical protein
VRSLEVPLLDGTEPGWEDRPAAEPEGCDGCEPDGCEPDGCEPDGAAAGAGASPQVSQYPSWIVPPQPGRVHVVAAVVVMAAAPVC